MHKLTLTISDLTPLVEDLTSGSTSWLALLEKGINICINLSSDSLKQILFSFSSQSAMTTQ